MENEVKEKKVNRGALILPIVSVAAFLMLVFGAGYAYFSSTTTFANANFTINLPTQTSLVCTKTDCSVNITPALMLNTASSNTSAVGTNTCSIACTCSGTPGASCAYNISLANAASFAAYSPTSGLGSGKEFTVQLATLPSGCTAQNSSTTENQVSTQNGKLLTNCVLTIASGQTSTSATVNATFKWYNVQSLNQTADQAGKSYKYTLVTN